ncbi:probable mediator of RNA polymerase II transcription subunit 26a [Telopea speciosissima]|uniref:probable mediator of RNA polymerase II transcription subunit 26a n=1 Tax=Telopea speciosissima TaxID=54955 RepID=UPI001CC52FBD|nr:probable mediator of RNA polymerase II transcription subunit 26a [Telopea speciosissima]
MSSEWDSSLDHWRKFFETADTNIFDIIEQAIRVAATDHPEEFKCRRDSFAEHLLSFKLRRCSGSKKGEKKSSDRGDDFSKTETVALTANSVIGSSDTMNPCSVSFGGVVSDVDEEKKLRATLENTKKRLREGYQRAENAKKLRKIQVMDLKDLPKQGLGNHKRQIYTRQR